jgi:hypothetical protein
MMCFRRSLGFLSVAALSVAAGCGDPTAGSPVLSTAPTASIPSRISGSHAWIEPQAARGNLAYVADSLSNALFVFSYSPNAMRYVGYVALGSSPIAECADEAQDVWVVTNSSLLLEFAHGGTTPIRTIDTPNLIPTGCSVDAATGDLAVAGADFNGGVGAVFVYKKAKGVPLDVVDDQFELSDCAYDGKGTLYADRDVINTDLGIDVLPKGAKKFQYVTSNQSFRRPGGMQWVAPYLIVADSDNDIVYRFAVSTSHISVGDSIELGRTSRVGLFAIYRKRIVAPQSSVDAVRNGLLSIYRYPEGGTPVRSIGGMSLPAAVAISLGPKSNSQ